MNTELTLFIIQHGQKKHQQLLPPALLKLLEDPFVARKVKTKWYTSWMIDAQLRQLEDLVSAFKWITRN